VAIKKILWAAGAITALGGAGTVIYNTWQSVPVPKSVKEYHKAQQQPMQDELKEATGLLTAITIPPIREVVCQQPSNHDMRELLNERVAKYKEKLGREYSMPPCPAKPVGN